jgi:AAHS family 4-hydroxybenzoate transporter-like MFS transporter
MPNKNEVNVSELIDQEKLGRYQIWVIVLCGIIAVLDGFDTQAIAFVAPVIADTWGMKVSAFGTVFGAGLFGLTIGALFFGPVADRFGRKNVLLLSMFIFGLFALLTAGATSMNELLIYRFLTGIGLGGAMPNIIAMTAEFSPKRIRNTMITAMFCGFPFGAVLGGLISSRMIPVFGWESVFFLAGIPPLILIPLLIKVFPESIRFLVNKDVKPDRVAQILNRIKPSGQYSKDDIFFIPEVKLSGFSVKHLFTNGLAKSTLLLWVVFFMNLLILYFLINWLPSVLQQAGFPIEKAIISTVLLNLGGIIGGILISRLMDKREPYKILISSFALAFLFVAVIGFVGTSIFLVMVLAFLSGFFVVGAQFCINALASSIYPTSIRSTGVGWALGIGRIGSIVGPVLGGLMLSLNWEIKDIFLATSIPALIAAIAILMLSYNKNPRVAISNDSIDAEKAEIKL